MPGESDLHKTLKKEACRWLHRVGYRCIAAEVMLRPLGIIDAVGTGVFPAFQNHLEVRRELPQTCFIECKASRGDFLRDMDGDGQLSLGLMERRANRVARKRRRPLRQRVGIGKFRGCLLQPMANLHYILAPAGLIQKKELPPRWGLLSYGDAGVSVVVRAEWQESAATLHVECAIARRLTSDIYHADQRALNSVNREIMRQQEALAERIRAVQPLMVQHTLGVGGGRYAAALARPSRGG